ncbi:Transmembrane protein 182 [Triplophysa tibetana]|uniref:Transmembrane protein 182 n=1 Tax=Triplophysa tibetana TaxID=1572043 RepID=A0A5A9NTY4_9TELE|nr:Transmembrane protein 182 [Triplophysa tibetana]
MHLVVLQFLAGFFGALTSMFLLGSLGSDYWLLVSESCAKDDATVFRLWRATETMQDIERDGRHQSENTLLFYHEGLFWRCSYQKTSDGEQESMLAFWITNQPSQKVCTPGYLSHAPVYDFNNNPSNYATGVLILFVVLMFAVWMQVSDSLERYGLQRRQLVCSSLQLSVHYGPSFMLAPTAAFLSLLTGLFLLLISSVSRASTRITEKMMCSLREECV